MKYLKMLSAVCLAVIGLVAMSGSASATVLCDEFVTPCPAGHEYPAGTKIEASQETGTSAALLTTSGSTVVTCSNSAIEGETTNTGKEGEAVVGSIGAIAFTGCTGTVTTLHTGTFAIEYVGPRTKGRLTFFGVVVTVSDLGSSCDYNTGSGSVIGILESDETATYAEIETQAVVAKESGSFLCPGDLVWDARYKVTKPAPLFFKEKTA